MNAAKRLLAWALYQTGPVCFACGRWGPVPCAGHEYGGTITQWRARRLTRRLPPWLHGWVDCRWTLRRWGPDRAPGFPPLPINAPAAPHPGRNT